MSAASDFKPGLEGVVAFETEIAEPDQEGGALRYRGVDIEDLVGRYPFEKVWGLLVDESLEPGLPHAEKIELQDPSGSVPADLQAGLATLGPKWGLGKLVDITPEQARDDLARLSAAALSLVAQSARGKQAAGARCGDRPGRERGGAVPDPLARRGRSARREGARHLLDLGCRARPERIHLHGADRRLDGSGLRSGDVGGGRHALGAAARRRACPCPADARCGRRSRAMRRVTSRISSTAASASWASATASTGRRIRGLASCGGRRRSSARRVSRWRSQLEQVALAALREKSPDRPLETNVEYWAAVVLDIAEIPPDLTPAMFGCARVAGWSAHILEQQRTGRLIRPSARYVGPGPRSISEPASG